MDTACGAVLEVCAGPPGPALRAITNRPAWTPAAGLESCPTSECESQRYLHLTRAVGDVQNPAEGRVAESRVGIGAPRPVKGIDQVAAGLQEHALAEGQSFEEPESLHGLPGAAQVTEFSRRIAQCQRHTVRRGGRRGEGCWVQISLAGASRIIERPSRR